MKNIRIGIICPSEIAFRRFLPSLQKEDGFTYISNVYLYKKYFVKNMKEAKMMFDQ